MFFQCVILFKQSSAAQEKIDYRSLKSMDALCLSDP